MDGRDSHDEFDSPPLNKPSRKVCIVPECKNRGDTPGLSFHTFPDRDRDKDRWKTWVHVLRLKKEPAPTARVCSSHFSIPNFISPTVNRSTERMMLRRSAVPDENLPQLSRDPIKEKQASDRDERAKKRERLNEDFENDDTVIEFPDLDVHMNEAIETVDAGIQVNTMEIDKLFIGRRRSMAVLFKNETELNAWTGLHCTQLLNAITSSIESLEEFKKRKHSNVTLEEEVLIVFIKMKTNLSFSCMAAIFNVHYQTISQSFYRTVPLIKTVCESLIIWPTQEQIKRNMPRYFRNLYEEVVAVLDCTEIALKKPKCLHCRIATYSHYKGRETAKYLIVVTPGGTISYVSNGYGGRTSDKQVVVQEKVLDKVKIGESVMTDKGFLIDDECRARGIRLVRPPFLRSSQSQLSTVDASENVTIAAARVHVESETAKT